MRFNESNFFQKNVVSYWKNHQNQQNKNKKRQSHDTHKVEVYKICSEGNETLYGADFFEVENMTFR